MLNRDSRETSPRGAFPSFSPVRALSRVALIAGLTLTQIASAITPSELASRLAKNEAVLLVDVRPAAAFAEGHIPGAINIPLNLLAHKQLPAGGLVVVYGDGVGLVDEAQALSLAKSKAGAKADVLTGGYAGWLAEARLSTAQPGVSAEKLPAITYDQLVATNKDNLVLVDLRGGAEATSGTSEASASKNSTAARQTKTGTAQARVAADAAPAATETSDLVSAFGRKLGVPVVAPAAANPAAKTSIAADARSGGGGGQPSSSSNALNVPTDPNKLLVLVADDQAQADTIARQLRAAGHYRFTVLIGGTESIRHEGRTGSGRMDGGTTVSRDSSNN